MRNAPRFGGAGEKGARENDKTYILVAGQRISDC